MRFEWDEEKRLSNIRKHGIDFADVWRFFESERVIFIDNRFDYNELRFVSIGILTARILTITYTETDEITRIITARKSTKNEQNKYIREITN
ncbi:BrnT family toxin [soil metagenome]